MYGNHFYNWFNVEILEEKKWGYPCLVIVVENILPSKNKLLIIFNKNDNINLIKLINITVTLITVYLYCYKVIIIK